MAKLQVTLRSPDGLIPYALNARTHSDYQINQIAASIKNSCKPKQSVLDPFGGSGSTLISCEWTRRRCFTMELDPRYCDVIVERWENFTGKTAKLIQNGSGDD